MLVPDIPIDTPDSDPCWCHISSPDNWLGMVYYSLIRKHLLDYNLIKSEMINMHFSYNVPPIELRSIKIKWLNTYIIK